MPVSFTTAITLTSYAPTQDADGNDVNGTSTVKTVQGVFAPGSSSEQVGGRDQVVTQPTVYLPAPAPAAVDSVTVLGKVFAVDGDPEDWSQQPSPWTGWVPDFPVVVRLKRVSG